jgi:hypothetical protein
VAPNPRHRSHLSTNWCPSYQYWAPGHKAFSRWETPWTLSPLQNVTNHVRRADYSRRRHFENYGYFWSSVHPKESCYQRRVLDRLWVPVVESGLSPRGGPRLATLRQGGPPSALCQSEPNPEHHNHSGIQTSTRSRQSLERHRRPWSQFDLPFYPTVSNVSSRSGVRERDSYLTL